jgi:hypothetical protein
MVVVRLLSHRLSVKLLLAEESIDMLGHPTFWLGVRLIWRSTIGKVIILLVGLVTVIRQLGNPTSVTNRSISMLMAVMKGLDRLSKVRNPFRRTVRLIGK